MDLTARPREAVILYFGRQCTELQIAGELGIMQPTVSQHLTGKERDSKKVGGALRKIRKTIRREASVGRFCGAQAASLSSQKVKSPDDYQADGHEVIEQSRNCEYENTRNDLHECLKDIS